MKLLHVSDFSKKVMKYIHSIPSGKVATYKQIAELAGKPQGSRGVAWILHSCATTYKLPWHRVLNSKGTISFEKKSHNYRVQKKKLESEGIIFSASGQLDLNKFQWKKRAKKTKNKNPKMFSGTMLKNMH